MKKYFLVLIAFFIPFYLLGQNDTDTLSAAKNVYHSVFIVDSLGNINQKSVKEIGARIPYLSIFNLSKNIVDIKLSLDRRNWSDFSLNAISKNVYRCDNVYTMYIIVDPISTNPIRAKIKRNKKYKIYYNYRMEIFEIRELL